MGTNTLEGQLLGNLLVYPKTFYEISSLVSEHSFQTPEYKELFIAIRDLLNEEGVVDLPLLTQRKNISPSLTATLFIRASTPSSTILYAKDLFKQDLRRRVKNVGQELTDNYETDDLEGYLEFATQSVLGLKDESTMKVSPMGDVLFSLEKEMERNADKEWLGVPTGIYPIDRATYGIQSGHLWIVGGYTSTGKSMFALQLALNMLEKGYKIAIISNEMTKEQIGFRLIGMHSQIPALKIQRSNGLYEDERKRVQESMEEFKKFHFVVSEAGHSIANVVSDIRMFSQQGYDLVILDYMGLVNVSSKTTEYEQMTTLATELQKVAKQGNIGVMALSQVSNESARSKSQVLGYKGSGAIASSADVGIELYRDKEESPNILVCNIKKNRHGATNKFDLSIDLITGRIYDPKQVD